MNSSYRDFIRGNIGRSLHQIGFYNWNIARSKRDESSIVRRLWAYLENYHSRHDLLEAGVYLSEARVWCYCDLRDWLIRNYINGSSGIYEWTDISHCMSYCQPGDHIVDVGANHGYWGFSLGRIIVGGAIYLVDANPTLCERLRRAAEMNKGMRASVFHCALGDGSLSECTFFTPLKCNSGTGSTVLHEYALDHELLDASRHIQVPSTSLDELVAQGAISRVDILKIDVEFGENAVIQGALKTLQKFRPRLVVCETSPSSIAFSTFESLGYRPYILKNGNQRLEVSAASDYWGNIFFTNLPF